MYCNKCGNKMSDTARFCNKCGAERTSAVAQGAGMKPGLGGNHGAGAKPNFNAGPAFDGRKANAVAAGSAHGAAKAGSFTAMGILSRISAVCTIFLMFLPWLQVPIMRQLRSYLTSLTGVVSISNPESGYLYSMYNVDEVANVLDRVYSSNGFSSIHTVFLVLWAVALVLLVIGLVRSFMGAKTSSALLPGGIVAAATALLWFAAISYLDGQLASQFSQISDFVQLIGYNLRFFELPFPVPATAAAGILVVAFSAAEIWQRATA